jgi:hypothetical protein
MLPPSKMEWNSAVSAATRPAAAESWAVDPTLRGNIAVSGDAVRIRFVRVLAGHSVESDRGYRGVGDGGVATGSR